MPTVTSQDGTHIAFTKIGNGQPLILVDGALCYRESGPNTPLAALLAQHFTVYTYDRRGRGASGDTQPYAVEREIEDLAALIQDAGGSALVYGISSGAGLALEATKRGLPIKKLALYEAPMIVDATRKPVPATYDAELKAALAADNRGAAVRLFMGKGVGLNAFILLMMRLMPAWKTLKSLAHTLPYDAAIMGDYQTGKPLPAGRWNSITIPTLVIGGGKSDAWMLNGVKALAHAIPNARCYTLAGQTHIVQPEALAPVLVDFFNA